MPGTGSPLPGQILRVSIREEIYTRLDRPLLLRGILCVSAQKGAIILITFDRARVIVKQLARKRSRRTTVLSLDHDVRVGKTLTQNVAMTEQAFKEPGPLSRSFRPVADATAP